MGHLQKTNQWEADWRGDEIVGIGCRFGVREPFHCIEALGVLLGYSWIEAKGFEGVAQFSDYIMDQWLVRLPDGPDLVKIMLVVALTSKQAVNLGFAAVLGTEQSRVALKFWETDHAPS
jgi:hypothetical protein